MNFKAFTILEMIINLAVMSIIVGMVYVIFSQFQKNVEDYSVMSQENFEIRSFYTIMLQDFYVSDRILAKSESLIEVVLYNESIVNYAHQNNKLIRSTPTHSDTLDIVDFQIHYLNAMDEGPIKWVDGISFSAKLYGNAAPINVSKNYMSNNLFETK